MTRLRGLENALDADSVDAQAAHWFARNRNAPDRATRKAFARWLDEPAHARAYHEFEQLWVDLAELQQQAKPRPLTARKPLPWRPALAVAAVLVCGLLAFNLGAPLALHQQQIAAQASGPRTFELPDGSTLFVNANTRLHIEFSAQQRNVYLEQGQVYLEVAADKERPLWVHSGEARVRVVGTGFDVRRGQQQLVVSVAHGQVAFTPAPKSAEPTLLSAGQQARYDLATATLSQHNLAPEQVADWRSGHLAFRNRELASLVDELNLDRAVPVELADAALGRYKVSGNLDVKNPDALLMALPALIPVNTVALGGGRLRIEARQ